jgi:hypothetical protein
LWHPPIYENVDVGRSRRFLALCRTFTFAESWGRMGSLIEHVAIGIDDDIIADCGSVIGPLVDCPLRFGTVAIASAIGASLDFWNKSNVAAMRCGISQPLGHRQHSIRENNVCDDDCHHRPPLASLCNRET